jgi:alginate O-acetyltransferase complex protein AlgI
MVFASLTFLTVFLPLTLAGYALLGTQTARNLWLTATSLLFYAWGEPVWLALLLFSSVVDWSCALVIEEHRGRRPARLALLFSLAMNLTLLGSFKYADLVVDTVNALAGLRVSSPGFALPVGISFYTFQSISYVVDVARGDVPAQRRFGDFLLFISLFHQLVAGPIVRYVDVARDLTHRTITRADIVIGSTRLCVGLFKKVALANVAGDLARPLLDGDLASLAVVDAWLGLSLFALQIYFDFAGYSDMAIGLGRMVGFRYRENFDDPYAARSVTDFWRRWHMSLGSFFRDYVYVPLGGRHHRPWRNLVIVWGLTGLWHGASWNFVLWGLYMGTFIALERVLLARVLAALPAACSHAYAVVVIVSGWALFYFTDGGRLAAFAAAATGWHSAPWLGPATTALVTENLFWWLGALALCTPWPARAVVGSAEALRDLFGTGVQATVVAAVDVVLLVLCIALLVGGSYNPFLYFRF